MGAKVHYFGGDDALLGALHHPRRLRARTAAVLLCNPFGEEASRAHRIYRVLAMQLERAGYACLRFDYRGTGDSAGASEDASIADWVADIGRAADELRRASGSAQLVLVGLRLGATLAAMASAGGLAVRHLIAWDPVLDGRGYLDELTTQHEAYLRDEIGDDWQPHPGAVEALGFPLTPALTTELAAIDLAAITPRAELLTVVSSRGATPSPWPRAHRIEAATSAAWNSDAALNAAVVPMDIVSAIVTRIEATIP